MAIQFIVENGTGLFNANSYATVAEADQYLENTGRKAGAWADGGNGGKQAALVTAFVYMFARWSDKWIGIAAYEDMSADWPRREATKKSGYYYDSTEIPREVKEAQIEYAYIHTNGGGLILNPEYDASNRPVIEKTEKVDVLLETTKFSDKISPATFRTYPMADNMLKNLVTGGGQFDLMRA